MTTAHALKLLSVGLLTQVCLFKPGHFAVMVTFDTRTQEFLLSNPCWLPRLNRWSRPPRISVAEVLFHTRPGVPTQPNAP